MRVLSARWTFFHRRIFPLLWFGILAFSAVFALLLGRAQGRFEPLLLVGPVLMTGFGYFLMRAFVFDLADEVIDAGNALVVRKAGNEARIALADIIDVDCAIFMNPPRISLTLRTPCCFGRKIAFIPTMQRLLRFNPLAPNLFAEELINRVDRARRST